MDSNNMAGMPDAQNQPVAPAEPTPVTPNPVEQALAEAPAEPAPMDVPMGAPAKKSGKGMLYGMIFFIILAVAGIGFGVYMMMDANTQKTSYDKQVADLKAQNSKLLEQLAEGGSEGGGEITPTPSVNTKDYIYIGEWGLKIKIPEELALVSYNYIETSNLTEVGVTGLKKTSDDISIIPDFAIITKCADAGILRYPKDIKPEYLSTVLFSDEEYNYYYSQSQAICSVDSDDEAEKKWELETANIIRDMLNNPDNYSAI